MDPDGQTKFFEPPNTFDRGLWDLYGDYIAGHGRELDKERDKFAEQFEEKCGWFKWDVGDWLLEGEEGGLSMKELRKRAEQKFAKRNRTWKTMRNWKVTSRAFRVVDGEPSRRRDGRDGRPVLSYSHHQLVEQFPIETQDMLLDLALNPRGKENECDFGKPLSCPELKQEIKRMRASNRLPAKNDATVADPLQDKQIPIKVRLRRAHIAFLKAIKPTGTAGLTAAAILQEYIEANLDALLTRAIAHDARWATVPRKILADPAEKWERVNWPDPLPGFTRTNERA